MSSLVPPHGGKLEIRFVDEDKRTSYIEKAKTLKIIYSSSRETSDVLMIGMGAFSPIKGFMNKADYDSVISSQRLSSGIVWPIPITLSVTEEESCDIEIGSEYAIVDRETNTYIAIITVNDKYSYDKKVECEKIFFTCDEDHPAVKKVNAQGDVNIGGDIVCFHNMGYDEKFKGFFATPTQTREIFEKKGWSTVAAFQTRNPLHRSHEFICKIGNEVCDGLFIHPIVGKLKEGDIPADIRLSCYNALIENYFNKDNVVLKVYPMEMRYSGPSEAILHAIIRQNFGCSHILIGRDHAGVGNYYGSYDAQEMFKKFSIDELKCRPINVTRAFYCYECEGMVTEKTCTHSQESRLLISGTKLRQKLSDGEALPKEFTRKEVSDILTKYYQD